MEEIIKKAIEGGYGKNKHTYDGYCLVEEAVLLDPLFWQALSNYCRWDGKMLTSERTIYSNAWKDKALEFYEINLTEGWDKAIKWLEDLITK